MKGVSGRHGPHALLDGSGDGNTRYRVMEAQLSSHGRPWPSEAGRGTLTLADSFAPGHPRSHLYSVQTRITLQSLRLQSLYSG